MPKKICFVGIDNYPILNPLPGTSHTGGASVQMTFLAKTFRDSGHQVSMITKDHGQPDGEVLDRIQVWKCFKKGAGIPGVRFIHPRVTSMLHALKKADADIYYQSCAGMATGMTAWHCQRFNKKFVYRVAHDTDCVPGKQIIRFWRDKKIYEYGLKHADLIIAQTEKQRNSLKDFYGLESLRLNMMVGLPEASSKEDKNIDILWVNNIRPFKRPELIFELASKLPAFRFVLIGGPCSGQHDYYKGIEAQANRYPNVDFLGPVPYTQVNRYFSRAKLFVNTSESEGFPNSFLQAWIRAIPVISFFDPDALLATHGLGKASSDIHEMTIQIDALMRNEQERRAIGEQARQFAFAHHSPGSVAQQYKSMFSEIFGV